MLEPKLDRIEEKIDKANEHLGRIDVTLASQHISLAEHIRRTAILEDEIKPIKKHVDMISGAIKLVGLISLVVGTAAAAVKIIEFIMGIV